MAGSGAVAVAVALGGYLWAGTLYTRNFAP